MSLRETDSEEKTSQTRQRLLFHGFMRLWLRNSGLCPSDSLATTAHFISWNNAIAPYSLLMSFPHCIVFTLRPFLQHSQYQLMKHLHRAFQCVTVIGHGGVMQAGCQITAHTHVHGFQMGSFLFEEIKIFPYGNGLDRQQGFLAQNTSCTRGSRFVSASAAGQVPTI